MERIRNWRVTKERDWTIYGEGIEMKADTDGKMSENEEMTRWRVNRGMRQQDGRRVDEKESKAKTGRR